MAENIEGTVQGPNGETQSLKLKVGGNALGITTKDLPLIIMMLLLGVGLYLAFDSLTHRLDVGAANQNEGFRKFEKLLELGHETQQTIIAEIQRRADKLEAGQRAYMEKTEAGLLAQNALLQAQSDEMRRQHVRLNANLRRPPDQVLPVESNPDDLQDPERRR